MESEIEMMTKGKIPVIPMIIIITGVVIMIVSLISIGWQFSKPPVMKEGQIYKLAKTELVWLDLNNGQGSAEAGRIFIFADRNQADKSVVVPLRDINGLEVAKINPDMEAGTVRLVRINIPARTIEGIEYPGYTIRRVEWNWSQVETQKHIPLVIPRS